MENDLVGLLLGRGPFREGGPRGLLGSSLPSVGGHLCSVGEGVPGQRAAALASNLRWKVKNISWKAP